MTDSIADFKDAAEQFYKAKQELRAKLSKDGKQVIANAFQEVLKDCPSVGIYFTMGAPSFNDGSPCYFRVHDMWICPVEDGEYGEEYAIDTETGKRCDDHGYPIEDSEPLCAPEQCDKLHEIWSTVSDEFIMQSTFGDNASVVITADSIEVGDWDSY